MSDIECVGYYICGISYSIIFIETIEDSVGYPIIYKIDFQDLTDRFQVSIIWNPMSIVYIPRQG